MKVAEEVSTLAGETGNHLATFDATGALAIAHPQPENIADNTARATVRSTRVTASEMAENGAGNAGNTHTPPKGGCAGAGLTAASVSQATGEGEGQG